SQQTIPNWPRYFRTSSGTQSSTAAPKSLTYTSLPTKTVAMNGSFPCETMAWELTLSTLTGSLSFSRGCTGEKNSWAPESDWPYARKFWSGWAGGSGSSRNSKRVQPFTLPCRKEMENDEIDWNGRGSYRSSFG